MIEKRKPYRNKKIRQSARGEYCSMMLSCCNGNPETVVFAHSNYSEDGKGAGQKADDIFGAYMCSACHDAYDHRNNLFPNDEEMRDNFHRAMKRTWRRMIDKGVLK